MENIKKKVEIALINAIKRSTTKAPLDLIEALKSCLKIEKSSLSIEQLKLMLENCEYGSKKEIPMCQDTGILNFFVEIGTNFPIIPNIRSIINSAVEKATLAIPMRGNSVDPFTNYNPENNLGENFPPIYIDIKENSNQLKITVLPKGGGAENISRLFMLNPINGFETFQEKILEVLKEEGGMPCPPVILGVGIGGDATLSMVLAKRALLRPLNQRHPKKEIAKIELELLEKVNKLNIGTMGFGGTTSCLDVHIEYAMKHPASFPVGLIVQCYMHRIASFVMNAKGEIINET